MTGMGVILPAREWTPACEELAEQVGENDENDDELIIVCDTEDDEVMEYHDPPEVKVVASGEPTGCSGKCNAVATGIEETESDIIILTDDDFEHGENWIRKVERKVEENGSLSTYPMFSSEDALGTVMEPVVVLFTLQIFATKGAWGGTTAFRRDDVDIDSLIDELRQTVTDDILIGNHLNDITIDRSLARV
ncbi:MAG: glycosyltransferase, partial [Halobacteria archaeon]|nr:glycosyltransferase [Halobacteria archaeon]